MSRPETEGPADFWSRRRRAVADEARSEAAAEEETRQAEARAALEQRPDSEILEELGLKDPETLEDGDDFKGFLRSEVPERLRRRALRRLWRTNPTLANLDALVDYGEDFTDSATVIDNLQTTYRVGKGMLAHIEKQLEAAAPATEPPAEDPVAEGTQMPDDAAPPRSEVASAPAPDPAPDTAAASPAPHPEIQEKQSERGALPQDMALPSPRRMRIVYDDFPKGET